ncbi:unnamed protein product [Leptidea sinapis]|uniref:Gustatory receptor n=1 Tax=Leptidea sinapis TaxID=189913 RepID=A0A5E4Q2U2_9NEOP|nr:unnamed protein product [Leptidea sinapis]
MFSSAVCAVALISGDTRNHVLVESIRDARTKEILGVFKLAITSNSLQFTSYNLYRLNYTTMFSTAVSVITYSIIVIQLF